MTMTKRQFRLLLLLWTIAAVASVIAAVERWPGAGA
jgi:hypothetical protein